MKKLFFFIFFAIIFILAIRTFWTLSHTLTPDYSVHYQAAVNVRNGWPVYYGKTRFTVFAYPVMTALFFIPLSFFPYHLSQTFYLTINFISLILISLLIPIIITRKHSYFFSALIFSFSYLSFPTKFTLGMGQLNLAAYIFLIFSLFFYFSSKKMATALFYAIACTIKPILILTIIAFLLKKEWKIVSYIILFFALFFLLSITIDRHALQDYFYYFQHALPQVAINGGREIYYNQGLMGFVYRTIPLGMQMQISYIGDLAIFLIGLFKLKSYKSSIIYSFSLLLSMIPILDTLSWQHHFVILMLPFSYLFYKLIKDKKWKTLGLVSIAYLLVSWNFANPQYFMHFPQIILLSNTFYGGLLLFLVLLFSRADLN